jgi:hypothetical protein
LFLKENLNIIRNKEKELCGMRKEKLNKQVYGRQINSNHLIIDNSLIIDYKNFIVILDNIMHLIFYLYL